MIEFVQKITTALNTAIQENGIEYYQELLPGFGKEVLDADVSFDENPYQGFITFADLPIDGIYDRSDGLLKEGSFVLTIYSDTDYNAVKWLYAVMESIGIIFLDGTFGLGQPDTKKIIGGIIFDLIAPQGRLSMTANRLGAKKFRTEQQIKFLIRED